jgi:hypothetical protein
MFVIYLICNGYIRYIQQFLDAILDVISDALKPGRGNANSRKLDALQ